MTEENSRTNTEEESRDNRTASEVDYTQTFQEKDLQASELIKPQVPVCIRMNRFKATAYTEVLQNF